MTTLPHNISALMRRRAIRTAMSAARGVTVAKRGNSLAALRGYFGCAVPGSGPC